MEKLTFKLDQFEGPLDLLLHLIAKHKLNLYDIQIDLLLEQYLAQMEKIPFADLEAASDFLEMASRLVYMKSAMLLPKYEDEGEQLKQELTGQLLEYQACKEAAALLTALWKADKLFCRAVTVWEADLLYNCQHKPGEILGAYLSALGKVKRKMPPPKEAFSGIVKRRVVSVQSRVAPILNLLYRKKQVPFTELFLLSEDRSEMVATFLAVLELVRSKHITVRDGGQVALGKNRAEPPIQEEEEMANEADEN